MIFREVLQKPLQYIYILNLKSKMSISIISISILNLKFETYVSSNKENSRFWLQFEIQQFKKSSFLQTKAHIVGFFEDRFTLFLFNFSKILL